MKNDSVVLLRLLIIHFLAKWIYIAAGMYALLIYCANSSWFDVWIVPCFFTVFVLVSFLCHKIKHLPTRLVVFQGVFLLLIFSLRVHFSDFQFSSIPAKLHPIFHTKSTLSIIFGLIVLIWPVGYVIGQITEPFRKQLSDKELARGLEKAGMWIGCIERTIIYIGVHIDRHTHELFNCNDSGIPGEILDILKFPSLTRTTIQQLFELTSKFVMSTIFLEIDENHSIIGSANRIWRLK